MCSPPTSMPWLLMCSLFHPFTLYKCFSFLFFALYIFILSNFLCYVKLCLLPFYMHPFKCPLLLSFLYILYTFLSATYDYPLQPFGKQVLNNFSLIPSVYSYIPFSSLSCLSLCMHHKCSFPMLYQQSLINLR